MILRRISEGIRKQDWFVVTVEILTVVVGIFIGLQVDDWNERRGEQLRASGYLARIAADLDSDLAELADRISFWQDVLEYGAKGLSYAETKNANGATQWNLLLAYFQASQVAEFITLQSTFDELKSAGELSLISDTDLRGRLNDYYHFTGAATVVERPAYRRNVRGVIPLDIQDYIWENCYTSDKDGKQHIFDCEAPVENVRVIEIVDQIANNTPLMAELRYWMSTMHVSLLIGRDRTISATELRTLIGRH